MAETKVIDLEVKTNLGSLKSQLADAKRSVQDLAEEFGHTSTQATHAAERAAELKLQIAESNKLIKAFNPAADLNSATTALGGVRESVGLVSTSLKVFGTDSEGAAIAMEKVGLAMELTSGISSIKESVASFKTLGAVIKSTSIFQGLYNFVMTGSFAITTATTTAQVAETAATVAQGAAIAATATATTGATVAMKLFRLALIATGIGAIIVGIGFLIANMGSLLSLFSDSAEANARNAAAVKANTIEIEKNVKANDKRSASLKISNDYQYAMAKATGATNEQLREMAVRHAQSTIEMEKNSVAIATQVYWKNKLKLQQLINAEADEEDIKNQRKNAEDAHKALAKEQKDYHDALADKKAVIRQNNVEIAAENYEANKKEIEDTKSHHTTKNKIVKDSGKDRKNAEDKEAKDRQDAAIKANKELLKLVEDLGTDILTAQQKAIKDRKDAAIKAEEDIYKNARGFAEASTIDNQNDFQAKQDLLDIERAILLQNKELTAGEIAAIDAKYRKESADLDKEELDRKQALNAQKMQMAIDAFSILQDATTLFTAKNDKDARRQFQINKALSLSSAIVNTALGVTSALATVNPLPGGNLIQAGFAGAAGAVSIAKIAGTQYGGFSGGGGGGEGGGGGGDKSTPTPTAPQSAPNFNLVGATGLNQLDMLGKPIQAFVVGGEVTTYQELERNRLRNATL